MNALTQFKPSTLATNECDWEWKTHITDDESGAEVSDFLGFDVSQEWVGEYQQPSYVEYTARLRWWPHGRARLSREMAVECFGAAAVDEVEARASEVYQESFGGWQ